MRNRELAELGFEKGLGCEVLRVVLVVVLIEEMEFLYALLVEFLQFFQFGFGVHLSGDDSFDIRNVFYAVMIAQTLCK